jgi:acetoin utilization protein AcuB
MLVRDRMTADPVAVLPEMPYDQALRLMRERNVRRFPVIDARRHVVGIVSEKDLLNAAPSPATTLSQFEMQTLLAKLTVSAVMSRQVLLVSPDTPLEEAARIMADNKIGGLPVTEEQELVGIITETDIFRTMIDMLGARRPGLRVTFRVADHRGALAQMVGEVARQGGNILAVTMLHDSDEQHPIVTLKIEDGDEERLVAMLRGWRIEVLDVRPS